MESDIILLITDYLSDEDSVHLVTIYNKKLLKKYCGKEYYDQQELLTIKFKVTHLKITNNYNFTHSHVTHIKYLKNIPIIKLPSNLYYLKFGDNFNQKICNLNKLNKLKIIKFGFCFNQIIDDLSNCICNLTLGDHFNQPIKKLPKKLKIIKFGRCFNQSIKDIFHDNIKVIKFGYEFNQPIDNYMPKNLQKIIFHDKFNQSIDLLPDTVTHIDIGCWGIFNQFINNYPKSLKIILYSECFNRPLTMLPYGLNIIKFGDYFDQSINNFVIPSTVKTIIFGINFNHPVDDLLEGIEFISFGWGFDQSLEKLPLSVRNVNLKTTYKKSVALIEQRIKISYDDDL